MSAAELIADPRFWSIERVHYGHNGECDKDGRECRRMRIGARIVEGCVTWFEGETFQAALVKAERGLRASAHEFSPSWRPDHGSYLYVSCEVCGVDGYAHAFPPPAETGR